MGVNLQKSMTPRTAPQSRARARTSDVFTPRDRIPADGGFLVEIKTFTDGLSRIGHYLRHDLELDELTDSECREIERLKLTRLAVPIVEGYRHT